MNETRDRIRSVVRRGEAEAERRHQTHGLEAATSAPVIAARIRSKATDGTLISEDKFVYILFRWQNMDGAESVREYVKHLVSTRDGLLSFLRGCVGRVLSSNGNYNNIENAAIGQLYPLEELDALVAAITEQEMETLDDASKEAVKLFRKPRSMGWRHNDED